MIGAGASSDGGQVLALEWVEGHLPGFPWTDDEVALVRAACESVATIPSSSLDGPAPGRLAGGDHLNHFDLRPDNLLIGRGAADVSDRAYVLDWSWVTLGPAWCDWVGIIPTMHDQGYGLGDLLASSRLSRDADPDAIDSFFAVIAVYMLRGLDDEPPHGTTVALRHHSRYHARIFLNSLAAHRSWC